MPCWRGTLHGQANARASRVECAVRGLRLDELEVASLRGEVRNMPHCSNRILTLVTTDLLPNVRLFAHCMCVVCCLTCRKPFAVCFKALCRNMSAFYRFRSDVLYEATRG